jgi:galactokinase/mevalonate kinase-like predicted kinase
LIKKNPAFSSEAERLKFFQIIIWLHEDGKDEEIISMLARDSFGNDQNKARTWFESVIADARELAEIIITQDFDALKDWVKKKMLAALPTNKRIDDVADSAKDNLNSLRNRLRSR